MDIRTDGTIIWVGPFYNRTGYGVLARSWATLLHSAGMRVRVINVDRTEPGINDCDLTLLRGLESTPIVPPVTAIFSHVPSRQWVNVQLPQPSIRILVTTFDGGKAPVDWISICSQMDQVWLATKTDWENGIAAGLDPETLEVIASPHPWLDAPVLPMAPRPAILPSGRPFRFLSVALFIPRRRWDVLIQAFLEEFHDAPEVELYLKVLYPEWHPIVDQPRRDLHQLISRLREQTRSGAKITVDEELGTRLDMMQLMDSCDVFVSTDSMPTAPVGEAMLRHRLAIITDEACQFLPTEHMVVAKVNREEMMQLTEEMLLYLPSHRGVAWPKLEVQTVRRALLEAYEMHPTERWEKSEATLEAIRRVASAEVVVPSALAAIRKAWGRKLSRMDSPSVEQQFENACLPSLVWEGAQFVHHSLALVNREMCLALAARGHELSIVPVGISQFGPEASPRFDELKRRFGARLSRPADVHVRHAWPPDFDPPREGHWVMIQPWEFGSIPRDWIEKMKDQVDEVWAYTDFVKQCYVDSGMPADQVQVVPLGVDTAQFHPGVTPKKLPTEKSFKFLFVGGTISRKGPDILLSAYVSAFRRQDDVCLVIKDMGGNTFYQGQTMTDQIRQLQANADAPEILYLVDDLSPEEMPGLYAACDCLVHPYRGEGFGLPIAEAMACGLPVIITGAGAALDFCDDRFGYLIPAEKRYMTGDSNRIDHWETMGRPFWYEPRRDILEQLMRHVVNNPEEARAKGRQGARHISDNFTWVRAAEMAEDRARIIAARPVRRQQKATSFVQPATGRPSIDCLVIADGSGHPSFWQSLTSQTDNPLRLTVAEDVKAPDVHLPEGWWLSESKEPPARALNQLLSQPGDDPVLLISSDVIVTPGWLARLSGALSRDKSIGIAGPVSNRAPSLQRVRAKYGGTGKELRRFAFGRGQHHAGQVEEVQYLGGFCISFDRSAYRQIGPLNENLRFPLALWDYFDRARQAGLRPVVVLDSYVHHEQLTEGEGAGFDDLAAAQLAVNKLLAQGEVAIERGDLKAAAAEFRRATETHPDLAAAHASLGATLMALGKADEAVPSLKRAAELAEASPLYNQLGVALFQAGDLAAAEAAFLEAHRVNNRDVQPLLNLIDLYRSDNRYEEATHVLKETLRLDPTRPEVLVAFATISLELGDVDGGQMALRRLQDVRPDHPDLSALREAVNSARTAVLSEA